MDTFTRSLVDVSFARMVAQVLLDSTQNCEAIASYDLAESIGFLDSVDAAVEQSLKLHPTIKSKDNVPRDPEVVRKGLVLERTGLLSTLVGLGAFDGLVSDESGNPVSFVSRIGIYGGFARVGDVPPKAEKKEGEKKGKNPDAWKKVPPAFVERMARLLPKLTDNGKTVNRDDLVIAMKTDAKIDSDTFLKEGLFDRWRLWASLTREGNPALQDSQGRVLYVTTQGRSGGLKRAVYDTVAETKTAEVAETIAAVQETTDQVETDSVSEEITADGSDQSDHVENV